MDTCRIDTAELPQEFRRKFGACVTECRLCSFSFRGSFLCMSPFNFLALNLHLVIFFDVEQEGRTPTGIY